MWRYRRFRRTTCIGLFCSATICGLLLARFGFKLDSFLWLIVALGLLLAGRRRLYIALIMIIGSGVIIGSWRGTETIRQLSLYQPYYGKKITLQGQIKDDPTYGSRGDQRFRLQDVHIRGQSLSGEVQVSTFAYQKIMRGDGVTITGKLRPGFSSYQAELSFAQLVKLQPNDNPVLSFRSHFGAGVRAGVGEPQASLGLGFVIGESSGLPKDLSDDMKRIGLTHIVVASGYNLTVLVRLARRFFARVSKYLTTLVSLAMMSGFLLITGLSPSMARAGLVTGLVVVAWHYGRHIHPLILLLFAASVTAFINPVYLWSDVGWYLSFTSFAGVLMLAPLLERRIFAGKKPHILLQVCFETICAQLATLPVELFIFGKLALLAIPANVLVDPLIPLAMVLTAAAGFVGMLIPELAGWVGVFVNGLIGYMVWVVHFLASIPWAQIALKFDAIGVGALCLVLVVAGLILYRKLRFNYLESSLID